MDCNTAKTNCECCMCGKKLQISPSKLNRSKSKVFSCSRECQRKFAKANPVKKELKFECFFCGKKFHIQKNEIDRLKDKRLACSKKCAGEKMTIMQIEKIERKLGINNFKGWLDRKYHIENLNTRDIAELVYGKRSHGPNIAGWMERFSIDRRDRSEAVAMQWAGNDVRREQQAERVKMNMGAGTPSRKRLIEVMQTKEYKIKHSISKTGERNGMFGVTGKSHPKWNENRTHEQRKIDRQLPEHAKWRKAVMGRDRFTCQVCGYNKGGRLVAHHLNGYNWDVKNRTNTNNGVTLCETCHLDFHKEYGFGNNTAVQFECFQNGIKSDGYAEQMELL